MRVVIKRTGWLKSPFRPIAIALFCSVVLVALVLAGTFTFYYVRYSRLIDERLQSPVFPNVSQVYAAPDKIRVGQAATADDIAAYLRRAGYGQSRETPKGKFELIQGGLRVIPGADSYFAG